MTGVRPSIGSVGDAYDNAMTESIFVTLECELFDRPSFKTKTEAIASDRSSQTKTKRRTG